MLLPRSNFLNNGHNFCFYQTLSLTVNLKRRIVLSQLSIPSARFRVSMADDVEASPGFADLSISSHQSPKPNKGERRGGRSGAGRSEQNRDVLVSKALSKILRHDAEKERLRLDSEGYAKVDELVSVNSCSLTSMARCFKISRYHSLTSGDSNAACGLICLNNISYQYL